MSTSTPARLANAKPMNRFELTKRLTAKLTHGEAVIGGIGNTNFDLWMAGRRPENFYMLGSMGLACPIALGVALAQPERRVIALEGDGSLLMQLGCLGTIAALNPPNLTLFVMDNGVYQITGKQKTATAFGADIVEIARGSGIGMANWATDEAEFDALTDEALAHRGPALIGLKIDDGPPAGTTERDPVKIRENFMRGLGVRQAS